MIKGPDNGKNSFVENLKLLWKLGFRVVPHIKDSFMSTEDKIEFLKSIAENFYYPIDGIVFKFDDIEYGNHLVAQSITLKTLLLISFMMKVMKLICLVSPMIPVDVAF